MTAVIENPTGLYHRDFFVAVLHCLHAAEVLNEPDLNDECLHLYPGVVGEFEEGVPGDVLAAWYREFLDNLPADRRDEAIRWIETRRA